ncbi:DeoR/GlpR family DNA-binding transcription regulator [Microbacterium testaceum]|uniref:DeoR/GlpR family DNA-binding transcription regulator n=1 Tax=Microbacterium testaceum TaxID=2033 RepID=UPI00073505EA|nr:DeoR/GlpR family DNA-binding transcription regulator [Microbacterium testaceum]KTS02316.1 cytochrome C [Microbacterium testaceum]KTS90465.1 cytochrome C [Microbacterium testaceum]
MLAAERRSRLLAEVRRHGAAAVPDLAAALGVSEMTIRRDLDVLAADGHVDKVRGGARHPRPGDAPARDLTAQSRRNGAEKAAIARHAASLVEPGMAVGLSGGSTTWALARELRGIADLTIVTNSLPVADVFARPDRADEPYTQTVVLTGGVRTPTDALVGPVAVASLEHLHCDVVFLGVRGMEPTAGLTTSNLLEAETNRALVAAGGRAVVLADHSKWGAVGLTTIVDLNEVDLVVTDAGIADDDAEVLRSHVAELWVAPLAFADE